MEPGKEFEAQQKLLEFFKTFQNDEPLAVTKNRVDLTKGFVDSSNEGSDLSTMLGMQQMKDPREAFYLFDDGFHTPALKRPSHPSFRLNDLREQAITQARFPEESPGATNRGIVEQLLEIVGARK